MMPECFVCLETTPPLLSPCACTTSVHPQCLQRLVDSVPAHQKACAVCKHPYRRVLQRTHRFVCAPSTLVVVAVDTCLVVQAVGVVVWWLSGARRPSDNPMTDLFVWSLCGTLLLSTVAGSLSAHAALYEMTASGCCCDVVEHSRVIV